MRRTTPLQLSKEILVLLLLFNLIIRKGKEERGRRQPGGVYVGVIKGGREGEPRLGEEGVTPWGWEEGVVTEGQGRIAVLQHSPNGQGPPGNGRRRRRRRQRDIDIDILQVEGGESEGGRSPFAEEQKEGVEEGKDGAQRSEGEEGVDAPARP